MAREQEGEDGRGEEAAADKKSGGGRALHLLGWRLLNATKCSGRLDDIKQADQSLSAAEPYLTGQP